MSKIFSVSLSLGIQSGNKPIVCLKTMLRCANGPKQTARQFLAIRSENDIVPSHVLFDVIARYTFYVQGHLDRACRIGDTLHIIFESFLIERFKCFVTELVVADGTYSHTVETELGNVIRKVCRCAT